MPDYRYINYGDLNYRSHMVVGNATLTGNGRGLLIVTGDLTVSAGGWVIWQGVVLVGGKMLFTTGTRSWFQGIVVSGLNEMLAGAPPGPTVLGGLGGGTRWWFDYCPTYVDATLSPLTGFAPIRNAWVDNWASY